MDSTVPYGKRVKYLPVRYTHTFYYKTFQVYYSLLQPTTLTTSKMSAASSSPSKSCGEFTLFHSKAKSGLYELSNLYGCEVTIDGVKYSSAEAAFHAMKIEDPSRFSIEGDLLDRAVVEEYLTEVKGKPVSFESHLKKGMVGVIAKQVIKYPLLFRFKILMSPKEKGVFDPEYEAWSTSKEVWYPIFKAKFKGPLLKTLLHTSGELVEFDRFAKADTKWGGKIVNAELVGRNVMGKLLTDFRDGTLKKLDKHLKRKRKSEASSPVKALKVVSHEEILKKAFKAAKESGTMIIIDDDEDNLLPSNWSSMNAEEKATYAFSHNFSHLDWMKFVQPELDALEGIPMSPEPSSHKSPLSPSPKSPKSPEPSSSKSSSSPSPKSPKSPKSPAVPKAVKMRVDSDSSDDDDEEDLVECSAACMTFSDAVESDPNAEAVGTAGSGLKRSELRKLAKQLNGQIYKIEASFNGDTIKGRVLHVPGFVKDHQALYEEIRAIPKPFIDTMMINRLNGKLCNKSRHNANLTDEEVAGNIAERVSSQFPFSKMPEATKLRNKFSILGDLVNVPKIKDLFAEINYYGIKKANEKKAPKVAPGIGPHTDGERNLVLGIALADDGESRILCVCPFFGPQFAGPRLQLELNPGDLYVFDRGAAGGSSYSGLHIRHWASGGRCDQKYIDSIDAGLHKKFLKKAKTMADKGKEWHRTEETIQFMESKVATIANITE